MGRALTAYLVVNARMRLAASFCRELSEPSPRPRRLPKRSQSIAKGHTAARVALWRALHVEAAPLPHVLEDQIGLKLLAPDEGWRSRGDMDPQFTRPFRASIVAHAHFIEDLVAEQAAPGVSQYVILGAGLDTFAQRRLQAEPRLIGLRPSGVLMDTFKRFNFKLSFDKQKISRVPEQVQIDRSLAFLKAIGQIDPILKNWFLCADGKDEGLTHNVLLDRSSLLREIASWKDSDSDVNDMSFVLWNGVSDPLKGGLSITYHARSGGSLPAGIEFSEAGTLIRCLQDPRQGIVELMATATDLWPEIYWGVAAPSEYLRKQRTFQDRQTVGWIGYCPHPLPTADFPDLAELRPTRSQGTIIVSCADIMDEKNVQHVKVVGESDIKLMELGLLPARS